MLLFLRSLCGVVQGLQGGAASVGTGCCCSSVVERVLGKDEVLGSSPSSSFTGVSGPRAILVQSE